MLDFLQGANAIPVQRHFIGKIGVKFRFTYFFLYVFRINVIENIVRYFKAREQVKAGPIQPIKGPVTGSAKGLPFW